MNFLAHAVLSFRDNDILAGNMMSDFVKGKSKYSYPKAIQKGITLHRMIDEFTDRHPATYEAKSFFRPEYRLYSGPIVDIIYDHFLANDSLEFPDAIALEEFAAQTYDSLTQSSIHFPIVFASVFQFMKSENWLAGYRMVTGIQKSLDGLARRALYLRSAEKAYELFMGNYTALQYCYEHFFPEVKSYALHELSNLRAD